MKKTIFLFASLFTALTISAQYNASKTTPSEKPQLASAQSAKNNTVASEKPKPPLPAAMDITNEKVIKAVPVTEAKTNPAEMGSPVKLEKYDVNAGAVKTEYPVTVPVMETQPQKKKE
jgi:hypothetical protein